ncbi:MAG: hypothetical protein ACYSO7_12090 [Planctomycetota bacterium]|jgi:hypothetical protein
MEDTNTQSPGEDLSPEVLKRALKAFKKRLKLTALDEDSRLGRAAGRSQAGHKASVPFSHPTSIRPKCGRNCAGRENSVTADTGCMSCPGPNKGY